VRRLPPVSAQSVAHWLDGRSLAAFLAAGGDPTIPLQPGHDETPIPALHSAIAAGSVEAVTVLLADRRVDANAPREWHSEMVTPLMLAAWLTTHFYTITVDNVPEYLRRRMAVLRLLLGSDRVDVNAQTPDGMTALRWAVRQMTEDPHYWVFSPRYSCLRRAGAGQFADTFAQSETDSWRPIPSHHVAKFEVDAVETLLAHPRMDARAGRGPPLLVYARGAAMWRALVAWPSCAPALRERDEFGCTVLFRAVASANAEMTSVCVREGHLSLLDADSTGQTALEWMFYPAEYRWD